MYKEIIRNTEKNQLK